jgi:predicted nucleic acid-binding protein
MPVNGAPRLATLRQTGRAMPIKDSLIAATALGHGLTVATRNRLDFEKAGVKVVDPFQTSESGPLGRHG